MMLIGAGERWDELYYIKGITCVTTLKVDKGVSLDLLHQRLGHPSMQVTKLVPLVDLKKGNENLNECCDVCQKQNRLRKNFLLVILEH